MLPDFFLQALHEKYTHKVYRENFLEGGEILLIKIPKGWKFLMNGKCVEQVERKRGKGGDSRPSPLVCLHTAYGTKQEQPANFLRWLL